MNKRTALLLLAAFFSAVSVFAADEAAFFPMLPQVMGEGGDVTASAHGYTALFTNPAGFSRSPGDFSFGVGTWIFARPDRVIGLLTGLDGDQAALTGDVVGFVNQEITQGGFGAGGLMGVGWSGSGIGLGAFMLIDSFISGPTIIGAEGDLTATLGFIGGLSIPITLDWMTLHVGGDVRPMVRIHNQITGTQAIDMIMKMGTGEDIFSALDSANALYGIGVGFDIGAILDMGGLSAGLSIRDLLGTTFFYSQAPFGTVMESLGQTQTLPDGTAPSESYSIPMNVSAGAAYNPDLGGLEFFVDPTVHIGLTDLVGVIQYGRSPWALLHIGAEAKVLSVLTLQAGLNQGYLTAGAGLHLLFLDLSMAIFTRELGTYLMDKPSSGASLEMAIRF